MLLPLLAALLNPAAADCMAGNLSALPAATTVLPASPEIIVVAYGSTREAMDRNRAKVSLVSGDRRVALERTGVLRGSFTDDQHLFTPSEPLTPGSWTLHVGGETISQWDGTAYSPVQWTVSDSEPAAPRWTGTPEVVNLRRDYFGCGPGVTVDVAVPVQGALQVEATVVDKADHAVTVRLPVLDGRVTLGHGMCSGLLELQEGEAYVASFVAIGADGAQRVPQSAPVRFIAP